MRVALHDHNLVQILEQVQDYLPPNIARAHNLLPLAEKLLREPLQNTDSMTWMGFRPSTADSLPIIAYDSDVFMRLATNIWG